MKYLQVIRQVLIMLLLASIFFACSSTVEKKTEDGFFEPIDKYSRKKSGPGPNEQIMALLQEQNKKLDDMVQQLNILAKKNLTDTLKSTDNLGDMLATNEKISTEMLMEMVREQNLRLNDVVEQLKILSQNQQNIQYEVSTQEREPIEFAPFPLFPTTKQLGTSLAYGKAIFLYQQQKYKRAINSFTSLLNSGIEPELQDNCRFWRGVCYFHLRMINKAMKEFTIVMNISGSDKIEGAYFMIGQCYEQLGNMKSAKRVFEKMLRKYPGGSLKQMAEIKLALLK